MAYCPRRCFPVLKTVHVLWSLKMDHTSSPALKTILYNNPGKRFYVDELIRELSIEIDFTRMAGFLLIPFMTKALQIQLTACSSQE